jgi:hypothetical protein
MKKLKATTIIASLAFIVIAALVITACKKDDNNDDNTPPAPENPLVGTYSFISATFNEPISVIMMNGDTNYYEAGDDAFQFVGGGLLGAAPCDNADNARLQLKADYTSWYVCQGETNMSQQGTWEFNDDKDVLKLSIFDPADFLINISEVKIENSTLSGRIPALPMPYDVSLPVGEPLPGGGINFQVADVAVEFLKQD